MKIFILGPAERNASIRRSLEKAGHECMLTETAISEADCAGITWAVVNGYAPILKAPVLAALGGRVVNVHPSYLPYGRGIFHQFWALFYGWPTGVSLHLMDEGIDTGPVLCRRLVDATSPGLTLRTFNARLLEEASRLFEDNFTAIFSGAIQAVPQEEVPATLVTKSRLQSEAFVELLPGIWETKLECIPQLGDAFRGNLRFISKTNLNLEKKS